MTIIDPGWVDRGGFKPNPGQFPIRVERHLNSFVGDHLPGVTTVTAATRYYALHGLIAHIAQSEELDEPATLDVLRRSEALLAFVTRMHSSSAGHAEWTPPPHGIDAILRAARSDTGLDLRQAAQIYSQQKWAFANPYRGSELTLKILSPGGFKPGEWFDHQAASSALAPLVEVARTSTDVDNDVAEQLSAACLCSTPDSQDGAWLASLLSGDSNQPHDAPSIGGLLWQFGRLVAVATTVGRVSDADTLADLVMYDRDLREQHALKEMVAPLRWRGALLRKESVYSLRLIWRDINRLVGGARPVDELVTAFADSLPTTTVRAFRQELPARVDGAGAPLPAERELTHLPDLQRWLAVVMLGADRLADFDGHVLRGFRSPTEALSAAPEEMSPGWFADQLDRFAERSLQDFGRHLSMALIQRSQRVALWKSRYDPDSRVLSLPARLHVRDGIAVKVYDETAPVPATRMPQYLSIARQAGMFVADAEGCLHIGPNGGRLA